MNNFDKVVSGSLNIAQAKAFEMMHTEMTPVHLLYGLLKNPDSYLSKSLVEHNQQVEDLLTHQPVASKQVEIENIRLSSHLNSWLTLAGSDCVKAGKEKLSEKFLIKFLPQFFPTLNIDYSKFSDSEEETEVPSFLENLNEKAMNGKLDPVIGRTKEIRAVMEILGRRSKNNPVLVGPAGVGKTAIIEGLAEAIVQDKVPDVLKNKTIYSLELGSLVAGTKYRGEFEEKIQHLLKFSKNGNGKYIIFIDEIHQLIGAGKTDGAMDAANLLKPALSRGELHCIGATTADEFQKYILKDPALERRFRPVPVNEPSKEDSIEILMGLKQKFEAHHGIKITDEAIFSSVFLSDQYITDKNLPDKAIDLIDESASALKLSAEAMPAELEQLQAEIRNKRILLKVDSTKDLVSEIEKLQKKFDESYTHWESEVGALKKVGEIKNRLEQLKFNLEKAQREQNYEEASKLKFSLIPETERELSSIDMNWELKKEHIAGIIARQTGIPVEKILRSKQESLLNLEGKLSKRVFGQVDALKEISDTLITSYAGLSDESRPLGSFLLKGPTGVGKTETAKALAENLFDNEENIVRIDMSEYSEKHSVAKLIGAPAGYIGYDDGGVLTEAIRRKPYSVILFDEIEKAHPDFSDILLQLLDDGRLTDNKGRTINFKNTIVLLTTNSKNIELDFKPEVLGRLDGVLEYHSLGKTVMKNLVDKQISLLERRLKSQNISIHLTNEVQEKIAELGYDPTYGARPLQSVFNKLIIRPLSRMIIANKQEYKLFSFSIKEDEIFLESSN